MSEAKIILRILSLVSRKAGCKYVRTYKKIPSDWSEKH